MLVVISNQAGFSFHRDRGLGSEEKRQQNVTQPKMFLQGLCSVASVAFHSMKAGSEKELLYIPA